jgi:Permuted papain-like amidase enzyme, YaeF/YiiX, C92 family
MGWLRDRTFTAATRMLTKPRATYTLRCPNNEANLRTVVRKGDVVLVDGEQRVSEVIKFLTQSSWSHAAFYVGDELLRRYPERRAELTAQFGDDAHHMVIEALMENGVVASPLAKYARYNLRLCRPHGLRPADLQRMLDEVLAQIGLRYDVKNGALLLPGAPLAASISPPRAGGRERAPDRGHLFEPDRARIPERRLPDPAHDRTGAERGAGGADGPLVASPRSVSPGIPPPAVRAHYAARFRPLALLRCGEVQRDRSGGVRLSAGAVGLIHEVGSSARRRTVAGQPGLRP